MSIDFTQTHECSVCGTPGKPEDVCPQCGRRTQKQPRQWTLSELNGMDPEQKDKILHGDRPSGSAPKVVNYPGSL